MAKHSADEIKGVKQKHKNKRVPGKDQAGRLARAFVLVLVVVAAFCGGFVIRGNVPLMASLGFTDPSIEQNPGQTVTGNTYDSLSARVAEMEGILKTSSLDSYDLGETTTGVLNSFVAATKDPYLRYFDASRYETYIKDAGSGQYGGIGVLFAEQNGQTYAADVFEGSEAAASGVQSGDFIVAIDGDSSQQWTVTEVTTALDRSVGSTVLVTWRRPSNINASGGDTFNTTLSVSDQTIVNVETSMSGSVGYIKVRQFTQNAADLVRNAVVSLGAAGAQSYVLDIRDCPGGYLSQAVDIASLFIKSGVVVQIQTNSATTIKQASGDTVSDKPLVVLVNGKTAAAAEVLAAALQDSGRASLVGDRTLGKGSVQVVRELSFGGALRYTAAYYKSPLGHDIDTVGVSPDYYVESSDDADSQLTLAMETAASLVQL